LRRLEKGWFLERTVVHRFKNEKFCGQLSLRGLDQVGSKKNSFVGSCHSEDSIQSEEGIRSYDSLRKIYQSEEGIRSS